MSSKSHSISARHAFQNIRSSLSFSAWLFYIPLPHISSWAPPSSSPTWRSRGAHWRALAWVSTGKGDKWKMTETLPGTKRKFRIKCFTLVADENEAINASRSRSTCGLSKMHFKVLCHRRKKACGWVQLTTSCNLNGPIYFESVSEICHFIYVIWIATF